jgi:hypothetical protein
LFLQRRRWNIILGQRVVSCGVLVGLGHLVPNLDFFFLEKSRPRQQRVDDFLMTVGFGQS